MHGTISFSVVRSVSLFARDLREPTSLQSCHCQTQNLVYLQSSNFNFKLGRDFEVSKAREQARCGNGRGPEGWSLGSWSGTSQHSVTSGNELGTSQALEQMLSYSSAN